MKPLSLLLILTLSHWLHAATGVIIPETGKKVAVGAEQNMFDTLDEYAKKTPKQYEENTKMLAEYLIIPAKSEMEKARLLFAWIATHIKYDATAYNASKFSDPAAAAVLKKKKAVCEGYANLMKELCTHAGLESEKVAGYSKGYGYSVGDKLKEPDHAWNVIKIDNKWRLMDVTWASGYGTKVDGKLKSTSRFNPYWFDVNPKEFIFSHLPEKTEWQLIEETITHNTFEKLPKLDDSFFKLGFNTEQVYTEAVNRTVEDFAETFYIPVPVKAIQLPYAQKLQRSDTQDFVLQSREAEEIVLIDGKNWLKFTKEGDTFSLSHKPKAKKIAISLRTKKSGKTYSAIIHYKVGK